LNNSAALPQEEVEVERPSKKTKEVVEPSQEKGIYYLFCLQFLVVAPPKEKQKPKAKVQKGEEEEQIKAGVIQRKQKRIVETVEETAPPAPPKKAKKPKSTTDTAQKALEAHEKAIQAYQVCFIVAHFL
jgi:hypothetical protein